MNYRIHREMVVMHEVELPNGDMVLHVDSGVCPSWYGKGELYFCNHNIFRLNAAGEVVWQVQRDEQGKRDWDVIQRNARQRGEDGYREPFMNIGLIYADGTNNFDPQTGTPPAVTRWVPSCRVLLSSLHGQGYELDIETGVARNISTHNRQW